MSLLWAKLQTVLVRQLRTGVAVLQIQKHQPAVQPLDGFSVEVGIPSNGHRPPDALNEMKE